MKATVVQAEDGVTWKLVGARGRVIAEGLTQAAAWVLWDKHDREGAQLEEKRLRTSIATGQW